MTESTHAPVLVFPDLIDTEGVLVWPPDRNFVDEEPFELVEIYPKDVLRTKQVGLKMVDRRSPDRELPIIQCHLGATGSVCEFELLLEGSYSRADLNFYCLILENIRHNSSYLERLRAKAEGAGVGNARLPQENQFSHS